VSALTKCQEDYLSRLSYRYGEETKKKLWLKRQGPGDAGALTLSAAQFVGIPLRITGVQTHHAKQFDDAFRLFLSRSLFKDGNIKIFAAVRTENG
jgi:hypothetical protein